jgi:hypothetical protein
MFVPSVPTERSVSPDQVWAPLATDLQTRAILLMARLAFNLVAAQAGWRPVKESDHAVPAHRPQDPA